MRERRIYYDKTTSEVIKDTGETSNPLAITLPIEEEIAKFTVLSERNRDTFDVLELPFGAYAQDFAEANGYQVNAETKTLEFSYPDPNEPGIEQPYQSPLSEKVKGLEERLAFSEAAIDFLIMNGGM